MATDTDAHVVHEAVGRPLSIAEGAATIGVGVNSLLVLGVVPVLLGALVDEHRLSNAGIGQIATLELLGMGLTTAAVGAFLKPRRLRTIGVACSLGLAAINLLSAQASGFALFPLRVAAGAVEGVLLWITVSMIARTVTPERWAGVFFAAQTFGQLVLAVCLAMWVMPRFGADGGFVALAVASLMGVGPAFFTPHRFAPLPLPPGEGGAPPLRGWFALIATVIFVASSGAVSVYLQPLAHEAGLTAGVARTANWLSLAAQVAGAGLAVTLAGRLKYFTAFVLVSAATLGVWYVFGHAAPGWLFIGANTFAGFTSIFLAPFLVPFTIEADPSRRAALQSGAAQLFGGALGPLLASAVVSDLDVRGVLWLGAALLLTGLAAVAALRFTRLAPDHGRA
ncbi:MAG TPA: MFS transporter [Caulobacteraceae bacterium]